MFSTPVLHTRVPVTSVIGPGVPLNRAPLITRPCTLKETAPVSRLTVALPLFVLQGNVPLWIIGATGVPLASTGETGLSTFRAVITPEMFCQRTTLEVV